MIREQKKHNLSVLDYSWTSRVTSEEDSRPTSEYNINSMEFCSRISPVQSYAFSQCLTPLSTLNILSFREDVSLSSCDSSKVNFRISNNNEVVRVIKVVFFRTLNSQYAGSSSRSSVVSQWSDFMKRRFSTQSSSFG